MLLRCSGWLPGHWFLMPGFSGFVAICVGGCNTIVLNGILSGWFVMFFWFLPCVCGCYTVANVF